MTKQIIKLTLILSLILFSVSLNAQIDNTKTNKGVNINFLNGYAISYKWNTTQKINYRIYLGLNSSLENNKGDFENSYTNISNYTIARTQENKSLRMNLSFQFLYNIITQKTYNMYVGIGPNMNYRYYETKTIVTNKNINNDNTSEYTTKNNSYGFGIISLFGIEAFLTNNISLFAETHLSAQKGWTIENSNSSQYDRINSNSDFSKQSNNTSGWSAEIQLVKVGLGIYF